MPINSTDALRYPVGPFSPPAIFAAADREAMIGDIESLPASLRNAVAALSETELDTPYRPGGWTPRQIVHHIADGHMSATMRFRLALTELSPPVKAFDETAWAELIDAKTGPIEPSLAITDGIHQRWVMLLRAMTESDFARTIQHPERGALTLDFILAYFAWHSRHHVAQILTLRQQHNGQQQADGS